MQTVTPFTVKICGATSRKSIEAVEQSGADAIGLNFVAQSARRVVGAPEDYDSSGLVRVGVFMNADLAELNAIKSTWKLDLIQLHGSESVELAKAADGPIIRAIPIQGGDLGPVRQFLDACDRANWFPAAVLLDALVGGQRGGTGATVDWYALTDLGALLGAIPFVLAGGLDPENVAEAIRVASPSGVDTASGVEPLVNGERRRGWKDADLCRRFTETARAAFGRDTQAE